MRPSKKTSPAFTLIEILVSIAILAILVALIFFGVERVQERMGVTKCISNLRQVHTALMSYTQDHGGMMPGKMTSTMTPHFRVYGGGQPTSNQLSGYLAPYLNVPTPLPGKDGFNYHLSCPAFLATLTAAERVNPLIKRSYGIPITDQSGHPFGYITSASLERTREPKNFYTYTTERNPSEAWILRDVDAGLVTTDTSVPSKPSHLRGRNYLYADGSARFLTPEVEKAQNVKYKY